MTNEIGTFKDAISPRRLVYLRDNKAALGIAENLRWQAGKFCPRCRSTYVKDINSSVFRRLFRCIDCSYIFNSMAGTVFQGTKLPISKFYQAFVLRDALGDALNPKELALALNVSPRTGGILMERLIRADDGPSFTVTDPRRPKAVALSEPANDHTSEGGTKLDDDEGFFRFCEEHSIFVSDSMFRQRLCHILLDCAVPHEEAPRRRSRA